ncbi:hypothetical protein N6L24_13200 [Cognatishimia sp. SS12]|uniref:hypothetical protein n=1 Tax=Cognatishimia sp. SS12 TaxID=2979465 RepID=UPI00232E1BD0|nr:hypothetical protein [Cognatishimia sp. SS12]MDC0739238.1 hypothetical protein [Cognatishimia sp. SS12]
MGAPIIIKKGIEGAYWKRFNKNETQDARLALNFHRALEIKAQLLCDAQLRGYHEEAFEWHRSQAARLREKSGFKKFLDKIDEFEMAQA